MKMIMEASLIDVLAKELCCEYISDLRFLPACEYRKVARYIEEKIPADAASLFEWNDALEYLSGAKPESTQEAARERLIELLHNHEEHERCVLCGKKTNVRKDTLRGVLAGEDSS